MKLTLLILSIFFIIPTLLLKINVKSTKFEYKFNPNYVNWTVDIILNSKNLGVQKIEVFKDLKNLSVSFFVIKMLHNLIFKM